LGKRRLFASSKSKTRANDPFPFPRVDFEKTINPLSFGIIIIRSKNIYLRNEFLFINSLLTKTHLSSIKDRRKKERKTFFFDVV